MESALADPGEHPLKLEAIDGRAITDNRGKQLPKAGMSHCPPDSSNRERP